MQENLYQNIDPPQNNPLNTPMAPTPNPAPSFPKIKDKKILILIILGAVILVLLIISLIVTSLRRATPKNTSQITPTPSEIPIPTTSNSLVPEIYQDKFKNLDSSFQNDLNLEVPSIDIEVGK